MRDTVETALDGAGHGATKSVYARDPDGNEFEVMWMLPQASWGDFASTAPVETLDLSGEVRRWAGVRSWSRWRHDDLN